MIFTITRAVLAVALAVFAVSLDPLPGLIILACVGGVFASVRWMWRRVS